MTDTLPLPQNAAPAPASPRELLQQKLFHHLEQAFNRAPMGKDKLPANRLYLHILLTTHFKLSAHVATDCIEASADLHQLLERLAEAKGLPAESLF